MTSRGRGAVPRGAHNPETPVQFGPPQLYVLTLKIASDMEAVFSLTPELSLVYHGYKQFFDNWRKKLTEKHDNNNIESFVKRMEEKKQKKTHWQGTVLEFLKLLENDPAHHKHATKKIADMVLREGTTPTKPSLKYPENVMSWNFFRNRGIYGSEKVHSALMEIILGGARGADVGNRLAVLVGPTSSGKSLLITALQEGLEHEGPFYMLAGCPKQCYPTSLIPRSLRKEYEKRISIKFHDHEDICLQCRHRLLAEFKNKETDEVEWWKFPVETVYFSERSTVGIAIFEPSDRKSQDVTGITGRVDDARRLALGLPSSDPLAVDLRSGAAGQASGGILEIREIFRADPSIMNVFISLTEEKQLKNPEGAFPVLFVDTFIVGHVNLGKYKEFKSNPVSNEPMYSRIRIIFCPYNLRLDEEIKIYQKAVQKSEFRDMHLDPHAYELTARMALITRLAKGELKKDLMRRMDYYNGTVVIEEEDQPVEVEELYKEGERLEEGLRGLDYRFIGDAISVAQSRNNGIGCTSSIDIFLAIKEQVEQDRSMQVTPEEKKEFLARFEEFIRPWLDEKIRLDVNTAFVTGYTDVRAKIFQTYIADILAWRERDLKKDSFGRKVQPNEARMREIEEYAGISEAAKDGFRRGLLEERGVVGQDNFTVENVPRLAKGIDKKLCQDVKEIADHALADLEFLDAETLKRRNDALGVLINQKGHCAKRCAGAAMKRYRELLDEEQE
jgi:serine protein kinase